jgi:hypothetical protein
MVNQSGEMPMLASETAKYNMYSICFFTLNLFNFLFDFFKNLYHKRLVVMKSIYTKIV